MKYQMIFKRKSFHTFKDVKNKTYYRDSYHITKEEIDEIYSIFDTFTPLIPNIKVAIKIVENELTTCKRGQEYCILLYSEKKQNYLQNIGFIGEQLDLYLASKDIGALWFGIGKTSLIKYNELHFVQMIAICKVPTTSFRKNMFNSKRKTVEEIWDGTKYLDIANIARFSPSSCNTQPWYVKENDNKISIFRYKKSGKRGIMPSNMVTYQNLIDIGIFIQFIITILEHNKIKYESIIYDDDETNENELTKIIDLIIY